MTLPKQGRAAAGSASLKLGARDPRSRRNAQTGVGEQDLDGQTLEMQSGQVRVKACDGIAPLAENATLAQVVARINLVTRKLQGG